MAPFEGVNDDHRVFTAACHSAARGRAADLDPVVHGTADEVVPFEQSQRYAESAGGEATLLPLDGAGHFEPIDPQSPEVDVTLRSVAKLLA